MNTAWRTALASVALVLGPCSARARSEGAPKVQAAYLNAHYTAHALSGESGECGALLFVSDNAGGRVLKRGSHFILEGFGCELSPGVGLRVRCGREPVEGRRLPTLEVHEFAIDEQTMSVSGIMDLEGWSYCFSLKAELSE